MRSSSVSPAPGLAGVVPSAVTRRRERERSDGDFEQALGRKGARRPDDGAPGAPGDAVERTERPARRGDDDETGTHLDVVG